MTYSAAYKCVWIVTVLGERGGGRRRRMSRFSGKPGKDGRPRMQQCGAPRLPSPSTPARAPLAQPAPPRPALT